MDFRDFYSSEYPKQVRRACLILGSNEAADDIVQSAFVAVFKRWDALAKPGGYLSTTVLNGCHDYPRHQAVKLKALPALHHGSLSDDNTELLWDVLQTLPFNQRAAVVLRFWDRCSEAEIAEYLDCAVGSVGPWVHRALRKMRSQLDA